MKLLGRGHVIGGTLKDALKIKLGIAIVNSHWHTTKPKPRMNNLIL
jgi:hypothetical protein